MKAPIESSMVGIVQWWVREAAEEWELWGWAWQSQREIWCTRDKFSSGKTEVCHFCGNRLYCVFRKSPQPQLHYTWMCRCTMFDLRNKLKLLAFQSQFLWRAGLRSQWVHAVGFHHFFCAAQDRTWEHLGRTFQNHNGYGNMQWQGNWACYLAFLEVC